MIFACCERGQRELSAAEPIACCERGRRELSDAEPKKFLVCAKFAFVLIFVVKRLLCKIMIRLVMLDQKAFVARESCSVPCNGSCSG